MRRTRIKFCGVQSEREAQEGVQLGVDALGCIFAPSPRQVDLACAERIAAHLPPFVHLVGVFVDHDEEALRAICLRLPQLVLQFSGQESPEYCERLAAGRPYMKVLHVDPVKVDISLAPQAYRGLIVFDTHQTGFSGGTGQSFAWSRFARPDRPFVLAGGLHAENVALAIAALRPYAVDVRSGIETAGRKDIKRMRAFVEAVHQADEEVFHAA